MIYVFLSFGSIHTGKALGACVLKVKRAEDANEKAKQLGLMPDECNKAYGYVMDEASFKEQGMELGRFYSAKEMDELGFTRAKDGKAKDQTEPEGRAGPAQAGHGPADQAGVHRRPRRRIHVARRPRS